MIYKDSFALCINVYDIHQAINVHLVQQVSLCIICQNYIQSSSIQKPLLADLPLYVFKTSIAFDLFYCHWVNPVHHLLNVRPMILSKRNTGRSKCRTSFFQIQHKAIYENPKNKHFKATVTFILERSQWRWYRTFQGICLKTYSVEFQLYLWNAYDPRHFHSWGDHNKEFGGKHLQKAPKQSFFLTMTFNKGLLHLFDDFQSPWNPIYTI